MKSEMRGRLIPNSSFPVFHSSLVLSRTTIMDTRITRLTAALLLTALLPLPCLADAAPGLKVFPATIELQGQDDRQSVVIQAIDAQGVTKDVTATAKLRLADTALAAIAG